ncbi:ficolin-1-like [Musca vetustissima]|uniref:ficolin-1-like n=1 Tax=Musca vetustissima TaxID=27455 RepID=UPI002AB64389|nr:ficolin-1-like [Musca vetustissima]
MRCQDAAAGNGLYNSEDTNIIRQLVSDVSEIKTTIDNLKLSKQVKNSDLPIFDIRVDTLPYKCQAHGPLTNCAEITACTGRSGYYNIRIPQFSNESFLVECDAWQDGGDWTVIQRRQDGSIDFFRTWSEYKVGFGDIDGEFFIGLDKLHALTNYQGPQELLIMMTNGTNEAQAYAKYDAFQIGNEVEKYKLKRTGRYSGTAGDSLKGHIGLKFTTKDQDNDNYGSNCAEAYMGGWWYGACHVSNLNGHYGDAQHGRGINWLTLSGHYSSLTYSKMMIRRRRN